MQQSGESRASSSTGFAMETAWQLFSGRQHLISLGLQVVDEVVSSTKKRLIEIVGSAAAGKSEIVLFMLATCILPEFFMGVKTGGFSCSAVLVDADYKFSALRLAEVLRGRLLHASPKASVEVLEEAVHACLDRFLLARCRTSTEVLATLCQLRDQLSSRADIQLVCLDSANAFVPIDKLVSIEAKDLPRQQKSILNCLRSLRDESDCCFVVTRSLYPESSSADPITSYLKKDFVDPAWRDAFLHRFVVAYYGGPEALFQLANCKQASKRTLFTVGDAGVFVKG